MRISTPAVQLVLDRRGDRRKALWLALISLVLFHSGVECRQLEQVVHSSEVSLLGSEREWGTDSSPHIRAWRKPRAAGTPVVEDEKTLGEQVAEAMPGEEAINNVNSCLEGPSFNSEVCRGLERQYRAIYCSDISPGAQYNCRQQATTFDKCNTSWMYRESFCLQSCNRCGDNCVDEVPPGYESCSPDLCESDAYTGKVGMGSDIGGRDGDGGRDVGEESDGSVSATGPWCLKTCRRCSPSPRTVQGVVELLP